MARKFSKRLRNANAALFQSDVKSVDVVDSDAKDSANKRIFTLSEACDILDKYRGYSAKFDETVELAIKLGIDPKKPEHNVRGMINMPYSTGKAVKIGVFVDQAEYQSAIDAGADSVDFDQLVSDIKSGKINFDVYVASTEAMPKIMSLARILGPKGVMPSVKAGTSGPDIVRIIKNIKGGQIAFKASKEGGINLGIGKLSFAKDAIIANVKALYELVLSLKPQTVKKKYVVSVYLSTSQGVSLQLGDLV